MENNKDWREAALTLDATGLLSRRGIAKILNVPRSTCLDFLRGKNVADIPPDGWDVDGEGEQEGKTHLVIPDSQVKPGVSLEYLSWIGQYIVRKRPDVVIHLGDFADMESLGSYDKGKRCAEGRRVTQDIEVAQKAMGILLKPLRDLQQQQKEVGEGVYNPRLVLTLGNHEDRITRHVEANPELHGFLSIDSLKFKECGWEVVPYLKPIDVDGIHYCHYFTNAMTGKPLSGTAATMLKTLGTSFTQGHRQCLDVATRSLPTTGKHQWGLICGACYEHEEDYKGMHNGHWRGIVLKHNVKDGAYDPLLISLAWLKREYGA